MPTLIEPLSTGPTSLFSFSNTFQQVNENVKEFDGETIPWFKLARRWAAGYKFDAKTSFAWGLGDVIDPQTYETTHLEFNPYIDLYGYWHGYSKIWIYSGFVELSAQITPFDTHVIEFGLQVPKKPAFWDGVCLSLGARTSPVHFEFNLAWSWPNCSVGLIESWLIPRLEHRVDKIEKCTLAYFGYGYGNDTPLWSFDFLQHFGNFIEFMPSVCFTSEVLPACAQPGFQPEPEFCDKNEPNCRIGCNPFSTATNFDC